MKESFWTDDEILAELRFDGPYAQQKAAWDQVIEKYQGELEDLVLVLCKGEDFFVSDIIERTWIAATDIIAETDCPLQSFLHSLVWDRCGESAAYHRSGGNRIPLIAENQDEWNESNVYSEDHSGQIESFDLEPDPRGVMG